MDNEDIFIFIGSIVITSISTLVIYFTLKKIFESTLSTLRFSVPRIGKTSVVNTNTQPGHENSAYEHLQKAIRKKQQDNNSDLAQKAKVL